MTLAEVRALAPTLGNLVKVDYVKIKMNNWSHTLDKTGFSVKFKDQADNVEFAIFTEDELLDARIYGNRRGKDKQEFGVMVCDKVKVPSQEVVKYGRKWKMPARDYRVKTILMSRPVTAGSKIVSQTDMYRFQMAVVKGAIDRAYKYKKAVKTRLTFKQWFAVLMQKLGLSK